MKPGKLSERDVTRQIRDFMKYRGWRPIRMQSATFSGPTGGVVAVGEQGMPDYQYLYYLGDSEALVLWIELKSPDDKRTCRCRPDRARLCTVCAQKQWRERETERGGVVIQVSNLRTFEDWYAKSFGWLHGPEGPRRGVQTAIPFSGGQS